MDYSERLDNAIDDLRDMLLDTVSNDYGYDIHDMIETVSMNHNVEKDDLLDWYDNYYWKNFE